MNQQANIKCNRCGTTIPDAPAKQPNHNCPQCGHLLDSAHWADNYPPKDGRMPQRQLILMMVLLPLLVVAMTVGSWYLIKAYRLPSVQLQSQSNLIQSKPVTFLRNSILSPVNFIKK